jgi:DNA-binding NtrC family response regulator
VVQAHADSRRSLAATLGISERALYRKLRRRDIGPMR